MNREYRGVDRPTDVLSFPFLAYEEDYEEEDEDVDDEEVVDDGDEDVYDVEEAEEDFFDDDVNPETGDLILGDIVISIDTARRQAEEYGHSFEREMGFLACHGMLHLLGYDHIVPEDEAIMRDMQQRIMNEMGLER